MTENNIYSFKEAQRKKTEKKKKKQEEQGLRAGGEEGGNENQKQSLWSRLDKETQDVLIDLARKARESRKAEHWRLDSEQLQIQRDVVRDWPDDDLTNFLKNPKNIEKLGEKPYLILAIYEKTRKNNLT